MNICKCRKIVIDPKYERKEICPYCLSTAEFHRLNNYGTFYKCHENNHVFCVRINPNYKINNID